MISQRSLLTHAFVLLGLSSEGCEQAEDPADLEAFAAHGAVFDKNMKEVSLDTVLIARIQDAMIELIRKDGKRAADTAFVIKEAQALLSSRR